jgi:hypothetical protein
MFLVSLVDFLKFYETYLQSNRNFLNLVLNSHDFNRNVSNRLVIKSLHKYLNLPPISNFRSQVLPSFESFWSGMITKSSHKLRGKTSIIIIILLKIWNFVLLLSHHFSGKIGKWSKQTLELKNSTIEKNYWLSKFIPHV